MTLKFSSLSKSWNLLSQLLNSIINIITGSLVSSVADDGSLSSRRHTGDEKCWSETEPTQTLPDQRGFQTHGSRTVTVIFSGTVCIDTDRIVGTLEGDWSDWFTQTHHRQRQLHQSLQSESSWSGVDPESVSVASVVSELTDFILKGCCLALDVALLPSFSIHLTLTWEQLSGHSAGNTLSLFLPHHTVKGAQHGGVSRDQEYLCAPHVPLCSLPVWTTDFLSSWY